MRLSRRAAIIRAIVAKDLREFSRDRLWMVLTPVMLGLTTDLPVTGDWNGDGVTDLGTWTPGTATYTLRVSPSGAASRRYTATAPEILTLSFGRPR